MIQGRSFRPNSVGDDSVGNDFAISEMDHDDIEDTKGRCFEPEPVDLPMGKPICHIIKDKIIYQNKHFLV